MKTHKQLQSWFDFRCPQCGDVFAHCPYKLETLTEDERAYLKDYDKYLQGDTVMTVYGVLHNGELVAVIKSLSTDTVKIGKNYATKHNLPADDIWVYELQVLEY